MRRSPGSTPPRSRPRRKAAAAPAIQPRNVGSVEGLASLTLGILMIVAALVPRTFKQLFLLGMGGGLVYRGLTGDCRLYRALGVDTDARPKAVPKG